MKTLKKIQIKIEGVVYSAPDKYVQNLEKQLSADGYAYTGAIHGWQDTKVGGGK